MKNLLHLSVAFIALSMMVTSCKPKERSSTTNWEYNNTDWGGFERQADYQGQATGPNLVFIEGGTFTMGMTEQDVMFEYRNIPRRVTVSSFYMDETEIANIDYLEYLYWLNRVFGPTYPEIPRNALPDTLVWREELSYNEPFVETYFRHPAFQDYPVVGVSWLQATEFCKWRTDRVNEMILVEKGILNLSPDQTADDNFHTESYLAGEYVGNVNRNLPDLQTGGERPVRFEDGILLPAYRLPTEAEWEYAALALIGNQAYAGDERITDRRLYPWDGNTSRYQIRGRYQGKIIANFKRGRGDYMGMAGNLNDKAHITAPVRAFYPNDFGLYNMAGNVNEWVSDIYRPLTSITMRDVETQDLNPYRGNIYYERVLDEDGRPVMDSIGRLKYDKVKDEDVADRYNYQRGNVVDYLDGDTESEVFYNYGISTLISDKARVYKGGSWADRAYYLAPGARRFLDEDKASAMIGFRCAMTRVGAPAADGQAGNEFRVRKQRTQRKFK